MTVHYIKPSNNADKGKLLLDVPKELIEIPSWLKDESIDNGFKEKSEYHVTVIGGDLADRISSLGAYDRVDGLINNYNWSIELTNTYIELAKDDDKGTHRQSIISLVVIPEMNAFFDKLEAIVRQPIERPPEHITLYTKNYDRGIALYSHEDLDHYTVKMISN